MKHLHYFLIVSLFFLAGCNSCNNTTETTKTDPNKTVLKEITVAQWGQEKYLIYLPFYVALEKGFFKEEGLNINVKYSGNDDQVFATVLKGDAMFGIGDPIFTAISREQGAKGKVVASIVGGVSIWGVTKKNIAPILKPENFAGLKVGTFPSPSTVYTLMKNTLNGLPKDAKSDIVQAPIGSQIALLENGSADIAMELEPGASIAESNGYKVVYSASKFYGPFAFTGVTTTEDNIANNKETVQKFVNAIQKSLDFIRNDTTNTIKIAQFLFPDLDKKVVANAVNRMISDKTIPTSAAISDEGWQKALAIRLQMGDIKSIKPTSDAVDNSFVNK